MKKKIANITVTIPYKRAGNIITQEPVSFDVYKDIDQYALVPCLSEDEVRVANLPAELRFIVVNGKPVSLRGKRDGNFHVILDAVKSLQAQQVI
jgi:hypothetical protein